MPDADRADTARSPCEMLAEFGASVLDDDQLTDWPKGADGPTFVVFVAPWCRVCQDALGALSGFIATLGERAGARHVDTDRSPVAVERLNVRSVPSVVLFAHGREVARMVGMATEEELSSFTQRALDEVPPAEEKDEDEDKDDEKKNADADKAAGKPDGDAEDKEATQT
jgi:thioredoxin-like negative regulator of GroEL